MKNSNRLIELTKNEILSVNGGRVGPVYWYSVIKDGFNFGRWLVRQVEK